MKKYRIFLIFIFIIMLIPLILKTLEKNHEVKYKKGNYTIKESFYIKDKIHYYDIVINNEKEKYSYTFISNLRKRKQIIKKINVYKQNNIKCILPIYVKKQDLELYCLEDNNQVSNYYLKDNKFYQEILNTEKKYKVKTPSSNNNTIEYKNLKVYQNNILDEYAFILWNYKGIYILKNNSLKYQKFLNYDLYDNVMSTVTSKYYVLFENNNIMGIENIHYYDIQKDKYKFFQLKEKISKDSYINGVVNDLIYITDNKKKIEYEIDLKKEKIEIVGNEELGYIKYINGTKENLNKSDFFMKRQLFTNELITNSKITSRKELTMENNYYYFIEDNKFYKELKNANRVLLFELDDIKMWYVYNRDVLIVSGDELYLYNDNVGLRKIAEYNELKYNSENIVIFFK